MDEETQTEYAGTGDALLIRISNRANNPIPSRTVLDMCQQHADAHGGRLLYVAHMRMNAARIRTMDKLFLYSSTSGMAVVGDVYDAGNMDLGDDPDTAEYSQPSKLRMPGRTWIAVDNARTVHINAHEWRLKNYAHGQKMNLALSFRAGTRSPYMYVEPDPVGRELVRKALAAKAAREASGAE